MIGVSYVDLNFAELAALQQVAANQLIFMNNQIRIDFAKQEDAERFAAAVKEYVGIDPVACCVDERHEDIADRIISSLRLPYANEPDTDAPRIKAAIIKELNAIKGH